MRMTNPREGITVSLPQRSLSKRVVISGHGVVIKAPRAWLRKQRMLLKEWRAKGYTVKPIRDKK